MTDDINNSNGSDDQNNKFPGFKNEPARDANGNVKGKKDSNYDPNEQTHVADLPGTKGDSSEHKEDKFGFSDIDDVLAEMDSSENPPPGSEKPVSPSSAEKVNENDRAILELDQPTEELPAVDSVPDSNQGVDPGPVEFQPPPPSPQEPVITDEEITYNEC